MPLQLSTHFSVADLQRSATAARNNIDNTAPQDVIAQAKGVAQNVLEKLCAEFGAQNIVINSWFRCEALERNICQSAYVAWCRKRGMQVNEASWKQYFASKQHPKGNAVDLEVKGVSNSALFDWIRANLEYDQLILEFHKASIPDSGWVHVSWTSGVNRKQAFSIG